MRVPIDWLKELVSFRAGADQLAEMLTLGGLETTLLPDEILDVDVLPNRGDCLSVRGIAREISAVTKFKLKPIKYKGQEAYKKVSGLLKVEVREKELCPRYMARLIENVKVGESPEWLKKRLERIGQRPINNVVDATNYLMHEIGQPLHAFDAGSVKEQSLIVRRANPDEKIITLDGKEQILNPDVLVIADPEKTIAIAGVMGGANTEVSQTTKTIILESAYFNPVSIHRTANDLKLRTEASVRFDHGVDWQVVEEALDRCAMLIAELGRGDVLKGKIDLKQKERSKKTIELRPERVNKTLGADITNGDMISILKRLGFKVWRSDSRLKVEIPFFRVMDIEREIDLVEEIARIYGINRIEMTMPNTAFSGKEIARDDIFRNCVRETLVGAGLNEVQTYSMLGPKDFEKTGIPADKVVAIANPLTVEESLMRTNILPGLLSVLSHNQNRQVSNICIFEIGKVFSLTKQTLPDEKWLVGGVLSGSPFMSPLDKGEVDFFYLKGVLENLFNSLGVSNPKIKESDHYLLQPGQGAELVGVGIFGALHPDVERNYQFTKPVFFFELDLAALQKLVPAETRFHALPKYPSVTRDISMVTMVENAAIIQLIKEVGGLLVKEVFPFDKYKDSVAYRVVYQAADKTLTETEVSDKHQTIVQNLTDKLFVRIR